MSKGLGGLIVAMMVVEDMDRYVDKRRARRAERLALKTYRVRRWARLGEAGRAGNAGGLGRSVTRTGVPRAVSSGVRPDPGAPRHLANCHAVHRSAAS